jgi:hypothetical protein
MTLQQSLQRIRSHFAAHLDVAIADENQMQAKGATDLLGDVDVVASALSIPPAGDVREALAKAWSAHRPTARNGWSGCTCGEENPGLTMNLDRWHETHLLASMAAEVRPRGTVTEPDDESLTFQQYVDGT